MRKNKIFHSSAAWDILSSLIAILMGFLIGFIILLICNPSAAGDGLKVVIMGGFANTEFRANISRICYYAVPMIVCGLSVSFAFKTGTLNLGASGQYWTGGFIAICTATYLYPVLGNATWIVGIILGALGGAVIAYLPGVLNAYRNTNIIITCIMMNYLATYIISLILKSSPRLFDSANSKTVRIPSEALIPKWGMDILFPSKGSGASAAIIIAVVLGIIIWFVISKTVFGYELKMCGFNRHAAHYTGVNEKRSIILSMVISGALSGVAGALVYLSSTSNQITVTDTVTGVGFTGIAVALLGLTNPIGVIAAGFFIAYVQVGGINLQIYGYPTELVDIMVSVIIYSCAFSQMIGGYLKGVFLSRQKEGGRK